MGWLGHPQDTLAFRCLSIGFRISFGLGCKPLGALFLVRDYIPAFLPVYRRVPSRIDLGRLGLWNRLPKRDSPT